MELAGKVAVVSGGSSGIGRATVLALAERGASVVVTVQTSP
jgi:NAD(P)-dependent dehydrogenase (short-subunit alcohol dehydrogenase family)